jgi:hypothetical protein
MNNEICPKWRGRQDNKGKDLEKGPDKVEDGIKDVLKRNGYDRGQKLGKGPC